VIEVILFDLDETLHSREQAFWGWLASESQNVEAPHFDRAQVERLDSRGRGDKRELLAHLDQSFQWGLSESARLERFRAGIAQHLELDPRVRDMLVRLRNVYLLGLVTNGTSATQRRNIEALSLGQLFDSITISEEVGFKKPDPRIFHHALVELRTTPDKTVFVGDDPISDVAGARAIGINAVQVGGGGPIEHVVELEAWLNRAP
jgi:putative hydrolase of the HAD superfamily